MVINAAGPGNQGWLDLLRTIRGQDEQDLGILLQTVHLVQQLVQKNLLAWAVHVRAFTSNEVHVLNDHHGRLQKTR